MDVVVIENWRAFSELSTLTDEWFKDNSDIKSEEQFTQKEQPDIDSIGCPISRPGYLIIFIKKKTYSRLDVDIYDNIVR